MTQSFSNFVGASPPQDNLLLARLVQEARQGGTRGRLAINQLRRLPGGREALQAVLAPAPPPPAPAPPPVAAAPPAPAPMAPPPQASPSFFDQTLGRGIGAVGRGVLGVGRFVQPVTTPVLENLGKAIETGMSGAVSTVGAVTPGDFMGLESNLAEERARRGIQSSLPKFVQASPLFTLESLIKGNAAKELQAQAAAWRATDMPSTRLNALPGQGIPLPGGKRLDEIDVGVKGAFELLPELALGIATGGGSAAGGLARRTATSAANVLGADIAMLGAKGALGAGRAATKGAKAVIPSGSTAKQADAAASGAAVNLNEKLALDPDTPKLFDQGKLDTRTPQAQILPSIGVEGLHNRYWWHRPPSHVPVPKEGGLNAYILKPGEAKAILGDVNEKGIWLGESKTRGEGSVLVDISKLDNSNMFVEQSGIVHRGDIPKSAIVEPPPTSATGTAAVVEPKQLNFEFIDDPDISPTTGKPSAVDEAFEVNQTKAVELPAGYAPGLVEDLIPKIVSPDVIRRAVEKSKAILKAVGVRDEQLNPSTLPGMAVSAVIKASAPRISSTANRLVGDIRGKFRELDAGDSSVFVFDDADTGLRIENLQGVPEGINSRTGKLYEARPTVADLAQDYGAYKKFLSPKQQEAMDYLRVTAQGLTADMNAFGFESLYKAELGDGGFFISRGPTRQEVEELVKGQKRTAKGSSEKGRAIDKSTGKAFTQAEMLEKGEEYLPVWDEMGQWSTEIYEAVLDKQVGKFVLNYVDPVTGERIALTTKELAGIELTTKAHTLRAKISSARRRLGEQQVRLTSKQQEYVRASKAFNTYTGKLSKLTAKLEEATTVAQVQRIVKKLQDEAKNAVDKAEEVLKTKQGRLQLAKMHSADLQDQIESLVKFEESQKELLANAAQRLESQQLKGTTPEIIERSLKEVSEGEKFIARTKKLRERAEGLFATARKREDAADAAEGAAAVDVKLSARDLDDAEIPLNGDAAFVKAREELKKFKVQVTARKNELDRAGKRSDTAKRRYAQSKRRLINLQLELDDLKPKIDFAIQEAQKGRSRGGDTKFRSINGNVWLNTDDLQTIRRSQEGMQATTGRGAKVLGPLGTYQSIRRAVGSTLDDSGISIQGKSGQFSNPREYAAAWKDHLQSLIGKPGRKGKRLQRESMADNIRNFDKKSQADGAPSSHEIIDRMGIRHGGVDTEVTLRPEGITGTIGKAPLIRRANEAFGAFGDMFRLRQARSEIMEYMRMSGKTFDELVADGTARQIGNGVNGLTGWTPNGVAGVFGDILLFAPRFFRARIETLHRATKGMDVDFMVDALPFDRQIRRNLNINFGIRNNKNADQLIARRAVMKLVSMGTLITVAANEVLGQETDFQLMRNGRMNPNFMSVRLTKLGAPRDWNIFGPYKSMAALILASAGAGWEKEPQKALDAWLNLSSPLVGDIFEFMNFKQYGESRFGETLGEYIAESHIPFALQEVPNIIKESATGNPKDAFGGGLSMGLEFIGEQSSALSRSDILQDRVTGLFKEGKLSADNYEDLEPYEQNDVKDALVAELEKFDAETAAAGKPFKRFFATIDIINKRRDSQLQEALVFYNAGRRSDGSEYTKREFTNDYFDIIDDARERKDQVKETLGVEFEDKIPADDDLEAQALKAWHEAPSQSLTAAGNYLPDKVKVLRNKVLADYPEQVDYIYRNTNDTPLPAGFLEALVRAGLESQVEKIMRSKAARAAQGAPPQPIVPSSTLTPPEQPAMGGGNITPMPPPLGSNPALKGLLKPSFVAQ